jgi:hypothetical protein
MSTEPCRTFGRRGGRIERTRRSRRWLEIVASIRSLTSTKLCSNLVRSKLSAAVHELDARQARHAYVINGDQRLHDGRFNVAAVFAGVTTFHW